MRFDVARTQGVLMKHFRIPLLVFALSVTLLSQRMLSAASPFKFPLPFKRVDADPKKIYWLTDRQGPWLIYAASFLGESGQRQAHRLGLELRSKHKLNAYVYKQKFDYGNTVNGLGVDRYGNPKKMKYIHNSQFEETAVLIGDYAAFDDATARKVLEKIKYMKPETLSATASNPTSQRMVVWREIQRRISGNEEMKKKGPMRAAFVTRNPMLPEEYFRPKGPDKLIVELNKGLEYSLLNCPGNFTVRVATFRGDTTWNLKEIEKATKTSMFSVGVSDSKLAQGAFKARKLVTALRKRGVEAYQFHDRHESIVSVGSFKTVGSRRTDGRIEINPDVHRVMKTYGAHQQNLPGLPGAMSPRKLDGIPFDPQPIPVQVPKQSVATDYAYRGQR